MGIEIDKLLIAWDAENESHKIWVYIHLNEDKNPAGQQYFSQIRSWGWNCLNNDDIRWKSTTVRKCQTKFADLVASEKWELVEPPMNCPDYLKVPDNIRHFVRECKETLKFADIKDLKKQFNQQEMMKDFSRKMVRGEVSGFQEYYEKAQEVGCHLSSRVALFRPALKNIEDCEAGKDKELPPL